MALRCVRGASGVAELCGGNKANVECIGLMYVRGASGDAAPPCGGGSVAAVTGAPGRARPPM